MQLATGGREEVTEMYNELARATQFKDGLSFKYSSLVICVCSSR